MALLSTALEKLVHFEIQQVQTLIDGDDESFTIDLQQFEGDICLILQCSDGGTSTADVFVTSSDDDDDNDPYTPVAGLAFTQLDPDESFQTLTFDKGRCKRWITLGVTTTATSSHTYGVTGVGASKYGSTGEYTPAD